MICFGNYNKYGSDKVWLGSTERRILQGCVYFLGDRSLFDGKDKHDDHVLLQNMVYFLQMKGWMGTDYEFGLISKDGMYSDGLEALLRLMDRKKDDVCTYQRYDQYFEELSLKDWRRINSFFEQYMQQRWGYSVDEWMKALAVCLYCKTSVYSSSVSASVVAERIQKEDLSLSTQLIEKVWGLL